MTETALLRTLALTLIFAPALASAQYRAFELVITDPTTGRERVEISTLDPLQYRQYHPTKPEEQISYRATWMCKGNTSNFKPICPNPKT